MATLDSPGHHQEFDGYTVQRSGAETSQFAQDFVRISADPAAFCTGPAADHADPHPRRGRREADVDRTPLGPADAQVIDDLAGK